MITNFKKSRFALSGERGAYYCEMGVLQNKKPKKGHVKEKKIEKR